MDDSKKQLGERIAGLRRAQGLTQQMLADMIDSTDRHISALENGLHNPKFDTLKKLADAFGLSLSEFLKGI